MEARMDGKADERCWYCADQAEPGRIETDNNGPIVDCPMCNPPITTDRKAGQHYDQDLADELHARLWSAQPKP